MVIAVRTSSPPVVYLYMIIKLSNCVQKLVLILFHQLLVQCIYNRVRILLYIIIISMLYIIAYTYNKSNSNVLILGDYNFPNIQQISVNNSVINNVSKVNNLYLNILINILTQHNLVYNRLSSMLYLVFSCMYHPALLIKISVLLF